MTEVIFHNIIQVIVLIAVPIIPNIGIKLIFKIILIIVEINKIFLKILCFPVICRIYPTGPEIDLTNWPKVRKIKTHFP